MRVATYNIHKCRGLDGRVRVPRLARVMRQVQADLWALQEVMAAQAAELAQLLGFHVAFGEARLHRGAPYGNATLARAPLSAQCIDLTTAGREPRIALRTDLTLDGIALHVFNLHLGTAHGERRLQAERLGTSELLHALDVVGPRIVMGDFNEWTHGAVTRRLRREFPNHTSPRGFPSGLPLLALDHIYWDRPLTGAQPRLYRAWPAPVASDHLPLLLDLTGA
ncbi:MAG TPA: endonuclease/exonuclease/phosphatase family protein [Terriglobales bacterium]|nr:endonuclease/exonuclease/phosphatase family protein [Terriglobales bacterium]